MPGDHFAGVLLGLCWAPSRLEKINILIKLGHMLELCVVNEVQKEK